MATINVGQTVQTSALKSTSSYSNLYRIWLTVTLNSQDLNANTSNITASVGITSTWGNSLCWSGGSPTFNIETIPNSAGWTQIATTTVESYTSKGSGGANGRDNSANITTLLTKTFTVQHNNDGTASFNVRTTNSPGSNAAYAPAAGTLTLGSYDLPTIPRAATVSVSPSLIEENNDMTVTVNAASSAHKVTVWYQVGSSSTKYNLLTTSTSRTATVTWSTINTRMGSNTSQEFHVFCTTYASDGTTQLGDTQSTSVWAKKGKVPMSWYDNKQGSVGVTVGEKATTSGFNVWLDTKFSTDSGVTLGGVLKNYIVEASANTTSGYNVYSNGLVEMWGTVSGTTTANSQLAIPVIFPKTLGSANACVLVSALGGATHYVRDTTYSDLTTTGMNVSCYRDNAASVTISWFVRGKI